MQFKRSSMLLAVLLVTLMGCDIGTDMIIGYDVLAG